MISKHFFSLLALVVTVPLQVCQAQIPYNSQSLEFKFNLHYGQPNGVDPSDPKNYRRGGEWLVGWNVVNPEVNGLVFDLNLGWTDSEGLIWTETVGYSASVSEGAAFFGIPENVYVPYSYQLIANFNGTAVDAVSEAFSLPA